MSCAKQAVSTADFIASGKVFSYAVGLILFLLLLTNTIGAGIVTAAGTLSPDVYKRTYIAVQHQQGHLTIDNSVQDIVTHPAFHDFGDLLLPWEDNTRYYATRLRNVCQLMPYHSHVNAEVVVHALNRMIDAVNAGHTIFYNVYTDGQKQTDLVKKMTGLFFFRGKPGAPFAIVCPGGGFSYVGSLHEGFPVANEISKSGLNAFVIRYRISGRRSGEQPATKDLAAAIGYVFRYAQALSARAAPFFLTGG